MTFRYTLTDLGEYLASPERDLCRAHERLKESMQKFRERRDDNPPHASDCALNERERTGECDCGGADLFTDLCAVEAAEVRDDYDAAAYQAMYLGL